MKITKSVPKGTATACARILLSSLIAIVFLTSCGGARKLQSDIRGSRDDSHSNFVQTTDGQIIEGDDLKVKYPFFKKAFVEINKTDKVKLKDVVVLQNDEGYYRMIRGQLAPRIKKGGINAYQIWETTQVYEAGNAGNGNVGHWRTERHIIYYVQKTDSGEVRLMSPGVVNEFVSDYEPAKAFMDEYYRTQKKVHMWSWINTGAVVGGLALVMTSTSSSSDESSSSVEPQGYVGLGLVLAGIGNGIANKIHKARNYKNLELAIDEYNRGYNKNNGTKKKKIK